VSCFGLDSISPHTIVFPCVNDVVVSVRLRYRQSWQLRRDLCNSEIFQKKKFDMFTIYEEGKIYDLAAFIAHS